MKYKFIINPKFESLTNFVNEVPQKFDRDGMLIYDSRNTVRVFMPDGEKIVVKRFHRSPLHHHHRYLPLSVCGDSFMRGLHPQPEASHLCAPCTEGDYQPLC